MKNNKGFTLIEIIGVIAILLAIVLVSIPSIVSIKNNNSEKNYNEILKTIYNSSEAYINLYEVVWENDCTKVYLNTLVNKKLIKAPIINPLNEEEFDLNTTYINVCKTPDNTFSYELK